MTDDVLNIMEHGSNVSDEQLTAVSNDSELRTACEDIMLGASSVRRTQEHVDVEQKLSEFHAAHTEKTPKSGSKRRTKTVIMATLLTAAAAFASTIFFLKRTAPSSDVLTPAEEKLLTEAQVVVNKSGKKKTFTLKKPHSEVVKVAEIPEFMSEDTLRMTIPYGRSCIIELGDGSIVHLHPGSRLVYPTRFSGKTRDVELGGEAYFVVAKDESHPFRVRTNRSVTTVLGTEFDITSEDNKPETITLVTGRVRLQSDVSGTAPQTVELSPGKAATIGDSGEINVSSADTEPYTSWRDGYFFFDNERLGDVLNTIANYYSVKVNCPNKLLLNYRVHFIVRRDDGIDHIIHALDKMRKMKISYKDECIYVK